MMPAYEVTLVRTVTDREVATVLVEADNEQEAAEAAVEMSDGEDAEDHEDEFEWEGEKRLDCSEAEVRNVKELPPPPPPKT
ncbi:MAG: hypothetical protein ICV73_14510 [Acetobacteraceae bacterium]|nr:hypothetical protein [Acetobacteraceae bacterium]